MKPSVARVVHYVVLPRGSEVPKHRPADVLEVVDSGEGGNRARVNLFVKFDRGDLGEPVVADPITRGVAFNVANVPQDEVSRLPGTWHWPEREPAERPPAPEKHAGPIKQTVVAELPPAPAPPSPTS